MNTKTGVFDFMFENRGFTKSKRVFLLFWNEKHEVPMTLKYGPFTSSGKSAPGPDPRIRHRIQIGMFRPIRVDHTNCLQVVIKTHSSSNVLRCKLTTNNLHEGDACKIVEEGS